MNATLAALQPALPPSSPRLASKMRSAEDLRSALRASNRIGTPDLAQLDRVLRLDAKEGRIEIQAGVRWEALSAYLCAQSMLDAAGLGPTALQAGLPATVGECVGCNPASPDGTPFSALIEGLAVVTADGELRRASRSVQPELFRAVVGGHGMIGAVYSVTLRIEALLRTFSHAEPAVLLDAGTAAGHAAITLRLMVPPAKLEGFLAELRQAFDDHRLPIGRLCVRRALPESETLLRWATEELALIDVSFEDRGTLPSRVAATQVRRSLIAAAIAHGGRFDLATGLDASREQVEGAYPAFSAFLAEKRRYDPQERLHGAWYQHYLALFRREPCEVRWALA